MHLVTAIRTLITGLWKGDQADALEEDPRRSGALAPMLSRGDMATAERILIIDDVPSNLVLLNNLLSRHYRVTLADSATKGLQLAMADQQPDLIILETRISCLDGFSICEMLQKNNQTKHIPIMFLSSLQGKDAQDRGIALGAVDFLFKPVPGYKLLEKIAHYFTAYGWVQRERRFAKGY